MTSRSWSVQARATLSTDELAAVRDLIATCDAHDGLRLKIALYALSGAQSAEPAIFLVYDGTRPVGCWSVDYEGGSEAETCGAVLPAYRRQGIGRALVGAACQALRARGAGSILLICEDASASGRAFVAAEGGQLRHKELHMECAAVAPRASESGDGGTVRPATRADVEALVRIMTAAFDDQEAPVRQRVLGEVDDPAMPYLVVTANGGEVIGCLKPYELTGTLGLYAVGVLPERQGQGYGKRLIRGAMAWLSARHPGAPFALEVDLDNAAAIHVYQQMGFSVTTVYGYYAL